MPMMSFIEEIKKRVLVYDGSKGYLLQKLGLKGGECPELWNVTRRDEIKRIYSAYRDAGADVIQTNTFQGNRVQLDKYNLGDRTSELNYEGTMLAKEVMGDRGFVAASIGPIGRLFEPSGDLTFKEAYGIYKEQVKAVIEGGADIINFETFTDLADMRAALLAAKETTDVPVICSLAFEQNGRTLMGSSPYIIAAVLKSLGANMVGVNCSFGPQHMVGIVKEMSQVGGIYLSVKPNAGFPEIVNEEIVYNETPGNFAKLSKEFIKMGARLIGGCCGTTPEFIKKIKEQIDNAHKYEPPAEDGKLIITSSYKIVEVNIPERLNICYLSADKDAELLSELNSGTLEGVTDIVMDLLGCDYDAIYINVDAAERESNLLSEVVDIAQGYLKEPFIIETSNPESLELALRIYRGKAGVIVGNGDSKVANSLETIAKYYGSTILQMPVL
jgi:5-methyltetrahydrofolate--homocysteine methyltransferase